MEQFEDKLLRFYYENNIKENEQLIAKYDYDKTDYYNPNRNNSNFSSGLIGTFNTFLIYFIGFLLLSR